LQQKQEVIHQYGKEMTDKSADLKTKGKEVLELRGGIKVLKVENYKLTQKLQVEEKVESSRHVHPDILKMSDSELKNKLLKLSEAYRTQRLKNEEFDDAIKRAYKDAETLNDLESDLAEQQADHQARAQRLQTLQQETAKEKAYQETVKKQEQVIAKLENMLEKSVVSKERARTESQEVEALKDDILKLQSQVKDASFGPNLENSEM